MQTNTKYKTHIKGEWTVDKMTYMLDNFKKAFPSRARRLENEWDEKQLEKFPLPPIDWDKPLTCNNTAVTKIEYIQQVNLDPVGMVRVCRLTYKQGYTYYTMYTEDGRSAGNNAGTINVKNKITQWGKSAWMILDKQGNILSSRWDSEHAARKWAHGVYGSANMEEFQYIRYDYTESL